MNEVFTPEIKAVLSDPQKSNSSYGKWAVLIQVTSPLGTGLNTEWKYFWKKKEANTWVQKTRDELTAKTL